MGFCLFVCFLRYVGLSLVWPLPLRSTGSGSAGSAAMAHGPSRSTAGGIFPDRGTNPCPLHRQVDSQPLCHQGSPKSTFYCVFEYFLLCICLLCFRNFRGCQRTWEMSQMLLSSNKKFLRGKKTWGCILKKAILILCQPHPTNKSLSFQNSHAKGSAHSAPHHSLCEHLE